MANFIEETLNVNAVNFVTPSSRYASSDVIRYTEQKLLTFKIYKRIPIPTSEADQFMVLTSKYEYRPDLLSFDVYGTVDFWWQIMQANNIYDIFDFKIGINIRIPNVI
jgi:hypothetical protein